MICTAQRDVQQTENAACAMETDIEHLRTQIESVERETAAQTVRHAALEQQLSDVIYLEQVSSAQCSGSAEVLSAAEGALRDLQSEVSGLESERMPLRAAASRFQSVVSSTATATAVATIDSLLVKLEQAMLIVASKARSAEAAGAEAGDGEDQSASALPSSSSALQEQSRRPLNESSSGTPPPVASLSPPHRALNNSGEKRPRLSFQEAAGGGGAVATTVSVVSAKNANRPMCAIWEAESPDARLCRGIKRTRMIKEDGAYDRSSDTTDSAHVASLLLARQHQSHGGPHKTKWTYSSTTPPMQTRVDESEVGGG